MRVGVKFCGHCNMHRDMAQLCGELRARNPNILFEPVSEGSHMDVLLVLNACPAACATRPPFSGPTVVATPGDLDGWPVEPARLAEAVERRLRELQAGLGGTAP